MMKKSNDNRKKLIKILGDNLSQDNIHKICVKLAKPKISKTIFLYLNKTVEETAFELNITESTVIRRVNNFINLFEKEVL